MTGSWMIISSGLAISMIDIGIRTARNRRLNDVHERKVLATA
jgi:hypothetical protein